MLYTIQVYNKYNSTFNIDCETINEMTSKNKKCIANRMSAR